MNAFLGGCRGYADLNNNNGYALTTLGKRITASALKLREAFITPGLRRILFSQPEIRAHFETIAALRVSMPCVIIGLDVECPEIRLIAIKTSK